LLRLRAVSTFKLTGNRFSFKNRVLTVQLPKAPEARKNEKKIEIKEA